MVSSLLRKIQSPVASSNIGFSDHGHAEEKISRTRKLTKLVHEGKYVAEVEVEVIDTDDGWSPYLSLEDAYKLDDVRGAS